MKSVQPQAPTTRWTEGRARSRQYLWDEPGVPSFSLKKNNNQENTEIFPPDGMDSSSAWAVVIIKSDMTGIERHKRYPTVFNAKSLNPSYVMKGQASKSFIPANDIWVYDVGFTVYQFHGEEREKGGLKALLESPVEDGKITSNHNVYHGERCLVQSNLYDPHKREDRSKKRTATTTSGQSGESQQKKRRQEEESKQDTTTHARLSGDPQQQKQEKGKAGESEAGAVSKRYGIFYTDDDEETPTEEQTEDKDEIIRSLRAELEQAQGKVVLLATTLEKVHRTGNPLAECLRSGVRLIEKAATLLGTEKGKELSTFAGENTAVVRAIMDPMKEACEELDSAFPATTQRVFIHDANAPTDGMKNWIEASATSYEKLKDDKDKAVNSQAKQC